MLGKLLKHEWIATARKYGVFYLVLGIVTLITAVMHALPKENLFFMIADVALIVIYILALIGAAFCSVGMAVVRFYTNLVSDEGYLTFTLPVKVEEIVFSKLLVAFCWQAVTFVLGAISLFLVFVPGHFTMDQISMVWNEIVTEAGPMLGTMCIMMPVNLIYQLLFYYLSIAIGQMFVEHKIVGAVVAYFSLSFALEMLMTIGMFVVLGIDGVLFMEMDSPSGVAGVYLWTTALTAVLGVVFYFVTCHLFKKKLNLA